MSSGTLNTSEKHYRTTKAQLVGAVESLHEGFALFDADDRLVAINDVFRKINPKAQEYLEKGMRFEDLIRANVENGRIVEAIGRKEEFILERMEQHQNPGPSIMRQHSNGRWDIIRETSTPDGGMVLTFTDITELKLVQDALMAAMNEAETANQAKSEFLASMSHELRTPLNAIIGFADILSHQYFGPTSDKYKEYAEDILSSGEHLLTLVNEILDLSTIEAGKQSLAKESLDVVEIVAECEKIVLARAQSGGIELTTQVLENGLPLYADRRAIKQILLNLLSNAIKFTPAGGMVELVAATSNDKTIVIVADTGRGISLKDLKRATEPFVHGDYDPYRAKDGWGLGLAITKSLVNLHGGEFGIKSQVGKGTTVTVTFPNGAS